jgi:secondary thiamine-phosphate synthase enzyme
MIIQKEISLPACKQGMHLITGLIIQSLPEMPASGILHLFLKHTSAAIVLNENADPSVRYDLESFVNRLVPEHNPGYTHTLEGADDMPAHIKSSLLGQSLTIPISGYKLNLGTWQGIYLCEFRNGFQQRTIVATIYG